MRQPASLRARTLLTFVVGGAIVGPLLAVAVLFLSVEVQERFVEQRIVEQLDAVVAQPAEFAVRAVDAMPGVHVLTTVPMGSVPVELLGWSDGLHEYEASANAWLVGLRTVGADRYAVVEDIASIELREQQFLVYALGGGIGGLSVALIIGLVVSQRLVTPVEQLADRVARQEADVLDEPFARGLPGAEIQSLGVALDRYRERARKALERERRFSADVSHELRNPLAVVLNAAELMAHDQTLSDTTQRALGRIEAAGRRMEETVVTLLALLREQEVTTSGLTSVGERMRQILDQEMRAVGEPHARVLWQKRDDAMIHASPVIVDVVAGNLVRNALQHARAGTITVTLGPDSLTVADDGIGMVIENPADGAERAGRDCRNTGLGLSLVQRLCDRFGWTLELSSELGVGTRAIWRFDRMPDERESPDVGCQ